MCFFLLCPCARAVWVFCLCSACLYCKEKLKPNKYMFEKKQVRKGIGRWEGCKCCVLTLCRGLNEDEEQRVE